MKEGRIRPSFGYRPQVGADDRTAAMKEGRIRPSFLHV